ncbi:acetyltransferase [Cryobacterium frigoriphilum]|uniref:Acetyltransferase n=1 Tax=Cryobacterium frigoriphilum TaxID=1259150 RepID=A0A4R9A4J2_9MICO|nr:acetyltransferase [Cryobacterium frigoriphilum]TFD52123.1 acetyltransferase [Cryobacterium frigoriphilum]
MVELLLVGASGLAREVLSVIRAAGAVDTVGMLDDSPQLWGTRLAGVPVLGSLATVAEHPDAQLVLCVGQGTARARIVERLADSGVTALRFARVVHRSVEVPDSCRIGPGSIVLAGTVLTADVIIGSHVVIMPHVTLTHGNRIDSFATLCAGVTLGGDVRVEAGAYLGMNSAVRQRVRIGAGAVIGMGAAVLHAVPAHETWLGVPAHRHENGPQT